MTICSCKHCQVIKGSSPLCRVIKGPDTLCKKCNLIADTRYCTECGSPLYKLYKNDHPYIESIKKLPQDVMASFILQHCC